MITISALQSAHIQRQEEWCPDQKPDLSFRGNEMAGEVGEACNVIKKLERERHGWRGSRATKGQLADELADVVHTAILCAITAQIDLDPAVARKFNSTSEKNGLQTVLNQVDLPPLLTAAKDLVDAIAHDDCGSLIGGKWMGGNGGLISRATMEKADALRRLVSDFEQGGGDHGA